MGGVVHSRVTLVPQKILNKTSKLKMAVCKSASRGCNQNTWRTPLNYLIFCRAVNFFLKLRKINSFTGAFQRFWWKIFRTPLAVAAKYVLPCKGENLHSEKSERPWKGFKSLTIRLTKSSM